MDNGINSIKIINNMETKHIMTGDLVLYKKTNHPVVCKIAFISDKGHVLLKFPDNSENIHTNIEKTTPIELSVEMLEDMGARRVNYIVDNKPLGALVLTDFKDDRDVSLTFIRCNEEGFMINLDDERDYVCFLIEEMSYLPVEDVHTLQDCLRIYGLTNIADDCEIAVIKNVLL